MNKRTAILLILLIGLSIFISGCTSSESTIKNQDQVTESLNEISTDVDRIDGLFEKIDEKIG